MGRHSAAARDHGWGDAMTDLWKRAHREAMRITRKAAETRRAIRRAGIARFADEATASAALCDAPGAGQSRMIEKENRE